MGGETADREVFCSV